MLSVIFNSWRSAGLPLLIGVVASLLLILGLSRVEIRHLKKQVGQLNIALGVERANVTTLQEALSSVTTSLQRNEQQFKTRQQTLVIELGKAKEANAELKVQVEKRLANRAKGQQPLCKTPQDLKEIWNAL